MSKNPLLEVNNLKTYFFTEEGIVKAVDGVDLIVYPGEVIGLVGESGCGKSVTSLSILRLINNSGKIVEGNIKFEDMELKNLPKDDMVNMRGNQISMIFQQPQSSLNPVFRIGDQIAEVFRVHQAMKNEPAWEKTIELLKMVGIPDAEKKANSYPHELSGGQAQRVMIAMALALNPKLLIADEPTTALDVTIQAQILDLLRNLQNQTGSSVILITHDLGVIAEMANRVAVMYAGRIVEESTVEALFNHPLHPYTKGLIASIPVLGMVKDKLDVIPGIVPNLIDLPIGCKFAPRCRDRVLHHLEKCLEEEPTLTRVTSNHTVRCWLGEIEGNPITTNSIKPITVKAVIEGETVTALSQNRMEASGIEKPDLINVKNLVKHFQITGGLFQKILTQVKAVDNVSFTIKKGETLGLVGESGCGKTTVGRTILRLIEPTSGSVHFDGKDIVNMEGQELKNIRRDMQIIFQDPFSSLNPRQTVGDSVIEGLKIHNIGNSKEQYEIGIETLKKVGLEDYHAKRFPHEFSGGQRQRIGIARALALQPKFIIADEPVSALDVSIQSQVLNILKDLQEEFNLTYLFIAHNMSVVEHISDRVAVMYLGKIVELASREALFNNPFHPYTKALMSAIPIPGPNSKRDRIILSGDVPSPVNPPKGCHFHPRCQIATDQCQIEEPMFKEISINHWCSCWQCKG